MVVEVMYTVVKLFNNAYLLFINAFLCDNNDDSDDASDNRYTLIKICVIVIVEMCCKYNNGVADMCITMMGVENRCEYEHNDDDGGDGNCFFDVNCDD